MPGEIVFSVTQEADGGFVAEWSSLEVICYAKSGIEITGHAVEDLRGAAGGGHLTSEPKGLGFYRLAA